MGRESSLKTALPRQRGTTEGLGSPCAAGDKACGSEGLTFPVKFALRLTFEAAAVRSAGASRMCTLQRIVKSFGQFGAGTPHEPLDVHHGEVWPTWTLVSCLNNVSMCAPSFPLSEPDPRLEGGLEEPFDAGRRSAGSPRGTARLGRVYQATDRKVPSMTVVGVTSFVPVYQTLPVQSFPVRAMRLVDDRGGGGSPAGTDTHTPGKLWWHLLGSLNAGSRVAFSACRIGQRWSERLGPVPGLLAHSGVGEVSAHVHAVCCLDLGGRSRGRPLSSAAWLPLGGSRYGGTSRGRGQPHAERGWRPCT